MIEIRPQAQEFLNTMLERQDLPGLGLRMKVINPGTPDADCELLFCQEDEITETDTEVKCDAFTLWVDDISAPYLVDAELDFESSPTGGQITVRAPNIKGSAPDESSPLVDQVRYLLDTEINPSVASHGGIVTLDAVTDEGEVRLRFGGGCHGCGMVNVTLKEGIERTFMDKLPRVTAVTDVTDHETGENPYYA